MKLGKAVIYFYNSNSDHSEIDRLEYILRNGYLICHIASVEEVDIEYHDNIDINNINVTTEMYEKYFINQKLTKENKAK